MQIQISRAGWWAPKFWVHAFDNTLMYTSSTQWSWWGPQQVVVDAQNGELLRFVRRNKFRLHDGRHRTIAYHGNILSHIVSFGLGVPLSIRGEQCEPLVVNRTNAGFAWEILTSQKQVVAAGNSALFSWRICWVIEIYSPEYLEEIIAFAIFAHLRKLKYT